MPTRGHTLVSLSTFRANARAASKLPVALRELPYSPSVTWSSRSWSFAATETSLTVTPTMVFTKYVVQVNQHLLRRPRRRSDRQRLDVAKRIVGAMANHPVD